MLRRRQGLHLLPWDRRNAMMLLLKRWRHEALMEQLRYLHRTIILMEIDRDMFWLSRLTVEDFFEWQ